MEKKISNSVSFIDGCVIERDFIYVASILDDVNPRESIHSRMSVYDEQSTKEWKWFYHDLNCNIISVCVKKRTDHEERKLCALSNEGEVEIFSAKDGTSILEKIPEAGLRLGNLGYVTQIREIGKALYVCGANDQVYRKNSGIWESLSSAPLMHRSALDNEYSILTSIDGVDENDIYVCGLGGRIYHFDGKKWKKIEAEIDENLNCVRCVSAEEIWICGNNGAVLKGNAKDGFNDVSGVNDNDIFWSVAKFNQKIYLATTTKLYVYDGKNITHVISSLKPELETFHLDVADDVLWSFGTKDITFFDGVTWTRIDHPDNPPKMA
jgi:ribosomal protein L37AE/L43A